VAYTLLVENAVQRDGYSMAGAIREFNEFAAGGESEAVETAAESSEAAQNEAAFQEVNQLMARMDFRG